MNKVATGRYAQVNGINLYYEVHGKGNPLILLHGGLGAIEMFGGNLAALAANHLVIAVDMQGHGRTADVDRPMALETMGDDAAALIKHLGFTKVDIMGYSMGGMIAQRLAIQHPDRVRKLVLVSCPCKRSGWNRENLEGMSRMGPDAVEPMKQTPMYALYAQIAPRVEDWGNLITKMGEMMRRDYDWSQDIPSIKQPTLLVAGDADATLPRHMVEFFELLGGGLRDGGWDGSGMSKAQLAILPGITHYTIFNSPQLAAAVIPFLDSPMPTSK